MSQRECVASGEAEAVTRPAGGYCTPAHPASVTGTLTHGAPAWDHLYRNLSPAQQRELLALAERQGLLYAHQLPVSPNGTAIEPKGQPLAGILNGALADMQPLHAEPTEIGDQELDAIQREAVARALATPDICLVQGRPGSGKSRVAAEIIGRANARGERVLFVAPTAAGIDRVLERVVSREFVFPVRCLDHEEHAACLPAAIRALTFTERVRALSLQALNNARCQEETDEQRVRRLRQDGPVWDQLKELVRQAETLEAECQTSEGRRNRLSSEVAEQADAVMAGWLDGARTVCQDAAPANLGDGFPGRVGELTRAFKEVEGQAESRRAELRGRMETGRQELAQLDAEQSALQPLADAKLKRRWWTRDWWRATIRGKSTQAQWAGLQERRQQIHADFNSVEEQSEAAARQWEEAKAGFATQKAELIAAEAARKQAELDDQAALLRQEQAVLQQKLRNACQALTVESPRPMEMTPRGIQAAHSAWSGQLERAEAQLAFTRQWITCLERTPEVLSMCLPGYFNLVAATIAALARDEHFGEGASGAERAPEFDLLVVEEADQLTEPQFLQINRRARRCVLIGEAAWPQLVERWGAEVAQASSTALPPYQPSSRSPLEPKPGPGAKGTSGLSAGRPGVFQRLWERLHCDPRQLPYHWIQEAGRLCCRLRHVAPEQRRWITSEHVADFPDIELRIVAVPHTRPALAEILFPSSFTIDRAKRYIFQELQELAVQASGASLRWTEGTDQVVLRLADRDLTHGLVIDLIPGVREILGTAASEANHRRDFQPIPSRTAAAGWETCCVEFDRSAGWDRARAAAWLGEHLGLCDLGRTSSLEVCYRWSGCVEFVPVPASGQAAAEQGHPNTPVGQRGPKTPRARALAPGLPRKGGAGLEIDLTDSRHRERLPAELRSALPMQGFVNYQEAQAVVRTLANLLKEPRIRELNGSGTVETCPAASSQPAVAVLALYPAQAELIRRLMQAEATLAALDGIVEVGVPAGFRQREAAIVLLSLTRSHSHRAVTFGEGPELLALAMTRARTKMVVFGDPGTLVRRSSWEGPVDHLDQDAAAHERHWITRLVHCLR